MKNTIPLIFAAVLLAGCIQICEAVAKQQCGPCGYTVTTPGIDTVALSAVTPPWETWSKADSLFVSSEFRWRVVLKMRERFEDEARQGAPEDPAVEDFSFLDYGECYSFGLGDFHLSAKYQAEGYPDLVLLEYVIDRGIGLVGGGVMPTAYILSRDQIVVLPRLFGEFPERMDDNLRMLVTQVLPNHRIGTEDQFLCLAKLLCVIQGGFTPFWIMTSDGDLPVAYRISRTIVNEPYNTYREF